MNWAANNNMSLSAYPIPVTANQSFGEAGVRSAASLDDFCDKKDRSIVFFMNTYSIFYSLDSHIKKSIFSRFTESWASYIHKSLKQIRVGAD